MHNDLATDIYNHLKNDTAKMPSSFTDDWLDPANHDTLPVIMGTDIANFYKQCVFTAQNHPIEDFLPLIWYSVSIKKNNKFSSLRSTYYGIKLMFRIFSNDSSGEETGKIVKRIIDLFDGTKCNGIFLWNACPRNAKYAIPFELEDESDIEPTSINEISKQILLFSGKAIITKSPRGQNT